MHGKRSLVLAEDDKTCKVLELRLAQFIPGDDHSLSGSYALNNTWTTFRLDLNGPARTARQSVVN